MFSIIDLFFRSQLELYGIIARIALSVGVDFSVFQKQLEPHVSCVPECNTGFVEKFINILIGGSRRFGQRTC